MSGKDQVTGCGSIERAFGSGGLPLRGQIIVPELEEGFLDALGGEGSDAPADGQCLPQDVSAFAGVAVLQVGAANSFQGACLLERRADLAGDRQCLAVVVAELLAVGGPGRQLAQAVQFFGLLVPLAKVMGKPQGLLVACGGGWVVAGQSLHDA